MPDRWLSPSLLVIAGLGWAWTISTTRNMSSEMPGMDMDGTATMSFAAFLLAWVAMMAAMMLPAILPVVRLYTRAAERGSVAPVGVFLAGYAIVWSVIGIPVYFVWRRLEGPLRDGSPGVGRLAGFVLVAAGAYQLSPLKNVCLRHCRSPMSFFLHHGKNLDRPRGAIAAGARHGLYCLGCCWMLMAVLVAFGTMHLVWMAGLAVLIVAEKSTRYGERVAVLAGVSFLALGGLVVLYPETIKSLT